MADNSVLKFVCCNAVGEVRERELNRWTEVGHYIKGFAVGDGQVLTFRKDRVRLYLDGCDKHLRNPSEPPPPQPDRERPRDSRPQILFTGFARVQRAVLEQRAVEGGLDVVQSVTKNLVFLCCGPSAGSAKVERSREQNVYVLREPDLQPLLETGELPDVVVNGLC